MDYAATYSSSSSDDSDMETSFESDDHQPQKSSQPRNKKSVSRKLIKLKRKSSAILTDGEMGEGGESDEIIPRNVDGGGNVYSKTVTATSEELSSSSPKDKNNRYQRRQRIIIDDDSDDED